MIDGTKFELRGRCPKCDTIRSIVTTCVRNNSPSMDAMENAIDKIGSFEAHCPKCDAIEEVAFFVNNKQTEPWLDADEYERRNGPDGGPLPPKPWKE